MRAHVYPCRSIVGRTPWSARVPLDPLFAWRIKPLQTRPGRTWGSGADEGVRPTNPRGEI
jgi:hypothetical protein